MVAEEVDTAIAAVTEIAQAVVTSKFIFSKSSTYIYIYNNEGTIEAIDSKRIKLKLTATTFTVIVLMVNDYC